MIAAAVSPAIRVRVNYAVLVLEGIGHGPRV